MQAQTGQTLIVEVAESTREFENPIQERFVGPVDQDVCLTASAVFADRQSKITGETGLAPSPAFIP